MTELSYILFAETAFGNIEYYIAHNTPYILTQIKYNYSSKLHLSVHVMLSDHILNVYMLLRIHTF